MNKFSICFVKCVEIFTAVLAFILTIEVCARLDDLIIYGAPFFGTYTADCLKKADIDGIPVNIPNVRFEKWKHNSFGFRGPEVSPIKSPGKVRIVCLGSSESYGLYESPDKEWPAQLRDLLSKDKYEVINASVVGLGLVDYKDYVKKHVLPLDPDLLICFANPLFYSSYFENSQINTTSAGGIVRIKTKSSPPSLAQVLMSNSRCLPKAKQVLKRALELYFPKQLQQYQVWNLQKQIEAAESKLCLRGQKPKDIVSDAATTSFKDELTSFVSFLESHGITVVLCTYPSLISNENLKTYPAIFLDNRRFFVEFTLYGMINVLDRFNFTLKTVALEKGTMLVDCQQLVPKTIGCFGDNVHYTDIGSEMIAKEIAAQLINKGNSIWLAAK